MCNTCVSTQLQVLPWSPAAGFRQREATGRMLFFKGEHGDSLMGSWQQLAPCKTLQVACLH